MYPRNKNLVRTIGIQVFRFEMIAKDCDIPEREFQTWGLNPTEGKKHVIFLTDTDLKVKEYSQLLTLNGVNFKFEDITLSVITMNNVDKLLLRAYNYNEKFKNVIDQIRLQYLTCDLVLDKICQFGKQSLDHIDLQVLRSI